MKHAVLPFAALASLLMVFGIVRVAAPGEADAAKAPGAAALRDSWKSRLSADTLVIRGRVTGMGSQITSITIDSFEYSNNFHLDFDAASGEFIWSGFKPSPNNYALNIAAPGYMYKFCGYQFPAPLEKAKIIEVHLDQKSNWLKGVVIDAETAKPIAGATVSIYAPRGAPMVDYHYSPRDVTTVETEGDGSFVLEEKNPPDFRYVHGPLNIRAEGYAACHIAVSERENYVKDGRLCIPLKRGGVISGIMTHDGQPLTGRHVYLRLDNPSHGTMIFYENFLFNQTVDKDGRFCFTGLPPGQYVIRTEKSAQSETLSLAEGEKKVKNFASIGKGSSTLSGQVRLAGSPAGNFTVRCVPLSNGAKKYEAYTDVQGMYRIELLEEGAYSVSASSNPFVVVTKPNPAVQVTISGNTQKDFDFVRAHEVRIKAVAAKPEDAKTTITVTDGVLAEKPPLQKYAPMSGSGSREVAANGCLVFKGNFKGEYYLRIRARFYNQVFQEIDIPNPLNLDNMDSDQDIDVKIAPYYEQYPNPNVEKLYFPKKK